jgi:hypothetical protein
VSVAGVQRSRVPSYGTARGARREGLGHSDPEGENTKMFETSGTDHLRTSRLIPQDSTLHFPYGSPSHSNKPKFLRPSGEDFLLFAAQVELLLTPEGQQEPFWERKRIVLLSQHVKP